ncbi:S8 family serine peptidase [Bacteroidales bacterium OttesenSCG-928-L19]|nr:S8 family serine peptidase [Bacteroidales bacterium OttesenSCG-928-L19]
MKRLFFIVAFLLLGHAFLWAQSPAKYWVQFTDKQESPYSIDRPLEYLSPKAIENRKAFRIPITESDLPVNPQYISKVTALDSEMIVFTRSKWLNGITIYSEKDSIIELMRQLPFVQYCEKTITLKKPEKALESPYIYPHAGKTPVPQLPTTSELDYGKGEKQIRLNNVHWLHRMGYKGEGMTMIVMDAGFLNADSIPQFKKLRDENRILGVKNFVRPDVDPFRKDSHGTTVLSCIAADVPGELIGSAPYVMVYLARTEDSRSENVVEEDNWVAGIEWADSLGCKVLNSSLGYTKFDDTLQVRTYKDLNGETSRASRAATIAASKGMIVCNSAGNEGRGKWKHIGSPADANDILSIGATNDEGKKASFSSFGPTADGRIKPDAAAVGEMTYSATSIGTIGRTNGTSLSSPLFSGMVVCLWQAFPHKSNFEIMDAIRRSGNQADKPNDSLGYGITDFLKAYNLLLGEENEKEKFTVRFKSYTTESNQMMMPFFLLRGYLFEYHRKSTRNRSTFD